MTKPSEKPRALTALPSRAETTTADHRQLLALPRVRALLDKMIEGLKLEDAADAVGMKRRRARLLIRNPELRKSYFKEMEDLRERERPRNILMAISIRDKGMETNATAAQQKVSIEAAKYLDGDEGKGGVTINGGNNVIAGYVIKLDGPSEGPRVIANRSVDDGKPLIRHEDVTDVEG
jgi:hypothetical protein